MSAFADDVRARLEPLGDLRSRRMFGGVGLYRGATFFAIAWKGALYFRVDDATRGEYERAGSSAFRPLATRPEMNGYYEVPPRVFEARARLLEWAETSIAVAERAAEKRPGRARAPSKALKSIGPVARRWLRAAGIRSRADLERVGSIAAYLRVRREQPRASLELLFALEATLLDLHRKQLPEDLKQRLSEAVGR